MKNLLLACLLLTLAACAGAPVQEMSDARQAIRAAQAAGAVERAPDQLGRAQSLIDEAQRQLQRHEYGEAQRNALEAREEAVKALQIAREAVPPQG
jgi:3-deoxy-D-manno-octulosonic-acid transferase